MRPKLRSTRRIIKLAVLFSSALLLVFGVYWVRFDMDRYYGESPMWRWKFAIYTGECDDETGCHFIKMENTGLLEYLGLKPVKAPNGVINTPSADPAPATTSRHTDPRADTLAIESSAHSDNREPEFTQELSPSGAVMSESRFADLNGCQKQVAFKEFDKNGQITLEWEKKYATDSNQTCDFSAFIRYEKRYRSGKLVAKSQHQSGCDECTETPCGTYVQYTKSGAVSGTQHYPACDYSHYARN